MTMSKYDRHMRSVEKRIESFHDGLVRALTTSAPKAVKLPKRKPSKTRTVFAFLSDTHYGLTVDPKEVRGNRFNYTVAHKRTQMFAQQVNDYKRDHRKDSSLVVLLGGDMIAGAIHKSMDQDGLAYQIVKASRIIQAFIDTLAQGEWKSIQIYCTEGNHGRIMHPGKENGRALTQKYDNYERIIYEHLKDLYGDCVHITKEPYIAFNVYKHHIVLAHGDTNFSIPNPGRGLNTGKIAGKMSAYHVSTRKRLDLLCVGHHHVATYLNTPGGKLIVNGSLSGTDAYARGIDIFDNMPTQLLWECTPEHVVGDFRMVEL